MIFLPSASGNFNEQASDAINTTQQTGLSWAGKASLGLMCWMGIWWLTEAVGISVTALLPIVVLPLMNVATIEEACKPYADPIIYMYLGGFILALAMERWGLGKRLALHVLRVFGTTSNGMIGGFMVVTALISAFVSNTATTAMMLPIALSVIRLGQSQTGREGEQTSSSQDWSSFTICLLLVIAHSSSVGGIATIVGTPTNAWVVAYLRDDISEPYRYSFSFISWLPIGISFVVLCLPVMYLVFTRLLFPLRGLQLVGGRSLISQEIQSMGKMQRGEWITLFVFIVTVLLWLVRPLLATIELDWQGQKVMPFKNLSDAGIAMMGAMSLLLIPVNLYERQFTVDWRLAEKIPWGILLLFGGGLSLANAVQSNGVTQFIGTKALAFGDVPQVLMVLMVCILTIFLSELASNTATAAALVPILAAIAPSVGLHPYLLVLPATIAASCGFMLPVATPPNAIIFGTGLITSKQMMRAGLYLNVIATTLILIVTFLVIKPLFQL